MAFNKKENCQKFFPSNCLVSVSKLIKFLPHLIEEARSEATLFQDFHDQFILGPLTTCLPLKNSESGFVTDPPSKKAVLH